MKHFVFISFIEICHSFCLTIIEIFVKICLVQFFTLWIWIELVRKVVSELVREEASEFVREMVSELVREKVTELVREKVTELVR